jgi:CheY-like chemotaxis protein
MKPKRNVLVVDDERTVCASCRKILSQEGYNVDTALSSREALSKVKGNGFDAVVTDWKMPEIDGIEMARRIKQEHPNVAVILITGYPSVETSIQAIRSGISDYLPKPFTPQELSDALIRALEKGQAVPADLVLDRLVEKGIVTPQVKPERIEAPAVVPRVMPAVTVRPVEEKQVGPASYVFKSVLAPVFGRLFFVFLGPLVIFALLGGLVKAALGKKSLE